MSSRWKKAWESRGSIVGRLLIAFGALLLLFGLAAAVVFRALAQLDAADAELAALEQPRDAIGRVAALVREQYIHQAHTIIERDRSHLDHYADIARNTRDAVASLRPMFTGSDDREVVDALAELVRRNHEEFMTRTVPAVDANDVALARELHAGMERVVIDALHRNRILADRVSDRAHVARLRADALRDRARWSVLGCFALSAAIAVIVGWRTTRWISRRVSTLRIAARELGAGSPPARIALDGRDEFAEIARSIEEMARELAQTHAAVIRSQRLASIGQVAAGVAHEINNPLGIILGYVKTMRRREARDDEGIGAIEAEAVQCRRIVQGLLDLARPDHLSLAPCDVTAVLRDTVARLEAAGQIGQVSFAGPGDAPVFVAADAGRLRQVFVNVVTNAVQASAPDGVVELEVKRENGEGIVVIRDCGAGIPEDARARLFQPFFTTKRGGVGLGLAIAHAIVDAHGGTIACEPGSAGGTVVQIRLRTETTPEAAP